MISRISLVLALACTVCAPTFAAQEPAEEDKPVKKTVVKRLQVQVQRIAPAKVQKIAPAKAQKIAPAQAKKIAPAQAKKVAPAKAKKAVPVKVKKVAKNRAELLKEYAALNKAYAEARRKLAEAEKEAAGAADEKAKQAAAKKVAEAKKKADETNKKLAKARNNLRGAAVLGGGFARMSSVLMVREKVDLNDMKERFALLLPGGPVVVEVSMTIDGEPFRKLREELVTDLLKSADKDRDGKATWKEALASPRFTLNRIRFGNDQQRDQYTAILDRNKNGEVERVEVRQYLAQFYGGGAFVLSSSRAGGNYATTRVLVARGGTVRPQGRADVIKLLDADNNGELSEKEIAAAPERLKSRDNDDNDLLYPQELNGGARRIQNGAIQVRQPYVSNAQMLTVMLGPTADATALFTTVRNRYQNEKSQIAGFSVMKELFAQLDADKDGKLQQKEVVKLNEVKPHIQLKLALGNKKQGKGLEVTAVTAQVSKVGEGKPTAMEFGVPGTKLTVLASLTKGRTFDYSRTAQSYMTRFDKDGNGYLDKNELAGNFGQMAQMWDADEDGKIYPKEITESYERMQRPQQTQIRATAVDQGNSVFHSLDLSGDGRLSLREMKTSPKQLLSLDKNDDKKISANEVPQTVNLAIGLGYSRPTTGLARPGNVGARPNPQGNKTNAPQWFTRMDRNGDGDVTLKEFLGDEADFRKLDTNNDGFIEPSEAKAAEKKQKQAKK